MLLLLNICWICWTDLVADAGCLAQHDAAGGAGPVPEGAPVQTVERL